MFNLRFVRFLYLHRKWDINSAQGKLNMKEIWKDVVQYEGLYQVSNKGNIKSLDKLQEYPYFSKGNKRGNSQNLVSIVRKGKIMKLTLAPTGYLCVGLYKNKIRKWCLVHRLVASAFLINTSNKIHVNHKDSNRQNNSVNNLEWCTPKENRDHAQKFGGLKNISPLKFANNLKLTDEQVSEIKKIKQSTNMSNDKISKIYGVTRRSIDRIISGESYKWLADKN